MLVSHVRGVVTERNVVRVLRTIVHVAFLCDLGDEEPKEDAKDDSLVKGVADHVQDFIVDAMHLLEALEIVLLGWGVSYSPESEVVHMAKHSKVVLKRDFDTLLFESAAAIDELGHVNVVAVGDRLTEVLFATLQVRKLIHFFYINYNL